MKANVRTVDVTHSPDLRRLADEVANTGGTVILRRGVDEFAIVRPLRRKAKAAPRAGHERGPQDGGADSDDQPEERSLSKIVGMFADDNHRAEFDDQERDSLWSLAGALDDDGPTDVSSNKHKYLAEAYTPRQS